MLALLLGALSLFAAASAEAQTAPTVSVAAGDGELTATFNTGGHAATQVSQHRMRWRVKDTDPSTMGDQAGTWLPSSSGHQFSSGSGASRTASVPPTSCTTCTALTNGTEYEVSMGLNWGGSWSGWSTPVSGTPQAAAPGAPTGLTVTSGNAQLSVSWTAPSETVTGYDVHYTSSTTVAADATVQSVSAAAGWLEVSRSGTTASQTISSLMNGTPYRVRVRAKNTAGNSAWVEKGGTPVVPLPTNVCVKTGLYPATGAVVAARGTPMISYDARNPDATTYNSWVAQIKSAADNWPARTNITALPAGSIGDPDANFDDPCNAARVVAGLTPGASYDVRFYLIVTATSQPAPDSTTPVRVTIPMTPPTGLTVTSGDAQLTVSWTAPSGSFGAYDLHFTSAAVGTVANDATASGTDPATAWVSTANSPTASHTSYTIDSDDATLTNGVTYRVRLRTSNPDSAWVFSRGTPMAPQVETPATDADLSALTASSAESSAGPFSSLNIGAFSASTTNYTATVPNTRTHVKLRPTVSNASATVMVNGTTVSSGSESAAIALSVGANTITVRVTNGANTRDYTVTITRQAAVQTTATVSLSPSPNTVIENNYMFVTATLSAPLANAVGIPLTVTNNSAEDGDYVVRSPKFSFPPNSTRSRIIISANDDADREDETLTVSLGTLPQSVTAGTPSSLRIRIFDDDKPNERNVRLWASPNPVPEGSPVTVRVLLYLDSQQTVLQEDVTIPVVVTRVTSETEDHGKLESITIPSESSSATGEIWTKRDADTKDETFRVALGTLPSPWTRGDLWFALVTISENAGRTSPGTGGGGGGTPPPAGDSPPDEEPQDPEQSDYCGDNDRENLVRLYNAADGDNWLENENWDSEESLRDWHGVDTDEEENVLSLRLSHNGLSGGIPEELLLCFSELKELALWGNEDLSAVEIPEDLLLAVERAVLREIAEMLDLNPEWFEDYEDPFSFEDWHEGVTTDEDGRVTELDLPGEIPESVISQFRKLREIMTTTSGGGCALSPGGSSAFSLFFLTLVVFGVFVRKRAR